MNLIIKAFFVFLIVLYKGEKDYKYILICTSKNCAPCIKTADDYMAKNSLSCTIVNVFSDKAEKQSSQELIARLCNESKNHKRISKRNKYCFGKQEFTSNDPGPFFIKYSKKDTIIYTASNIEDVNNQ